MDGINIGTCVSWNRDHGEIEFPGGETRFVFTWSIDLPPFIAEVNLFVGEEVVVFVADEEERVRPVGLDEVDNTLQKAAKLAEGGESLVRIVSLLQSAEGRAGDLHPKRAEQVQLQASAVRRRVGLL